MATSFGWKSKRTTLQRTADSRSAAAFADEVQLDPGEVGNDVDWLHNTPLKKQKMLLEDAHSKAKRLNQEAIVLAENGRYWEAIGKWDESLHLVNDNEKVLEMKAQALMDLNELFPAVQTAKLAVASNSCWWISWQTLGRALLNMGEIQSAINSFQKSIHLSPDSKEVWDDLSESIKLFNDLEKSSDSMTAGEFSFHVRECMRVGLSLSNSTATESLEQSRTQLQQFHAEDF